MRMLARVSMSFGLALLILVPGLSSASSPGDTCSSISDDADLYRDAFGSGIQVLRCEARTAAPGRLKTYVHNVTEFSFRVCVARRERVDIVEGRPRKVAPLPFETEIFMRMGDSRIACDSYAWEEFAAVYGVSATDFAAIWAHLTAVFADRQEVMSVLRRGMPHFTASEDVLQFYADVLVSSLTSMKVERMVQQAVVGESADGAAVLLRTPDRRVLMEVGYDSGKRGSVRIAGIRFPN